jgi:hypothetical protein
MERRLTKLCKEHGLRAISVMLMTNVTVNPVYVYVHWEGDECAGEGGNTFEEALAKSLASMRERRTLEAA